MHNELTKNDIRIMEEELEHIRLEVMPEVIEEVKRTRAFGDLSENKERRDFFIKGLNSIPGVYSPMPHGAFYTVASLPVADAEDFCRWCLTDFRMDGETVMMAPAAGFYRNPDLGRNQVRLAYVLKKEDLQRALMLLRGALKAYNRRTVY